MQITKIEEGKGKTYRIYCEDDYLFSLYRKELKRYHIEEMAELSQDMIRDILENVIYKRAKERALYLLERKPFSVSMMRDKLQDNEYPEVVIDMALSFLEEYHYLDDNEYVRMYVNSYSVKKSKKQLYYDLVRKGISKDTIEDYFSNNDYTEESCFSGLFYRYIKGRNLEDYQVRQKVFRYFYGKGFSAALIDSYLKQI